MGQQTPDALPPGPEDGTRTLRHSSPVMVRFLQTTQSGFLSKHCLQDLGGREVPRKEGSGPRGSSLGGNRHPTLGSPKVGWGQGGRGIPATPSRLHSAVQQGSLTFCSYFNHYLLKACSLSFASLK